MTYTRIEARAVEKAALDRYLLTPIPSPPSPSPPRSLTLTLSPSGSHPFPTQSPIPTTQRRYLLMKRTEHERTRLDFEKAKEQIHRRLDTLEALLQRQMDLLSQQPAAPAPARPATMPRPVQYLPTLKVADGVKLPVRDPSCLSDRDEARRAAQPSSRRRWAAGGASNPNAAHMLDSTLTRAPPLPPVGSGGSSTDVLVRQQLAQLSSRLEGIDKGLHQKMASISADLDSRLSATSVPPAPALAPSAAVGEQLAELKRGQHSLKEQIDALTAAVGGAAQPHPQYALAQHAHAHAEAAHEVGHHDHGAGHHEAARYEYYQSEAQREVAMHEAAMRQHQVELSRQLVSPYGQTRAALPPVQVHQPISLEQHRRLWADSSMQLVPAPKISPDS